MVKQQLLIKCLWALLEMWTISVITLLYSSSSSSTKTQISMDRLVNPDVKEVDMAFKRGQKCSTTFRLSNLMHTMPIAVSLTTTNPAIFAFNQPFSIIPPLSSTSYTLILSNPSDKPPLSIPPDAISVKSAMLPTGKAQQDDLRRLFSIPGPHIFKDATMPISFVGPHVIEHIISRNNQFPDISSFIDRAISGCTASQLTTLLRSVVVSEDAKLVASLVDHGADVNDKVDPDRQSIISLAVQLGNIVVVKALITSGCKIDGEIDQVLQDAAAMNRVDIMKALLAKFRDVLDVNSIESHGRTPIHIAAIHGHVEVIRFCVSIGGKTEITDDEGSTALHLAAENGHLKAVEVLLEASGFAKYAMNKEGKTAFAIALENNHSDLYDSLHLSDALHRAARVNDVHRIKSCLAEGGRVDGKDQNGWTPLHVAAFKGKIESVKVLLDQGAQIDAIDDAGYTPLHCAVEAKQIQVALLLLARGAKANAKNLKGLVPSNSEFFKTHQSLVDFQSVKLGS